ncbi:hypothetical protein [Nocardia sp. NPDC051570]
MGASLPYAGRTLAAGSGAAPSELAALARPRGGRTSSANQR